MSDIATVIEDAGAIHNDGRNGKIDGKLIAQPDEGNGQNCIDDKACGKNLPVEILPHIGIDAAQKRIQTGKDAHRQKSPQETPCH